MGRSIRSAARPRWPRRRPKGRFEGSADDVRDGFIHFSSAEQLEGTLAKHFAGQEDLVLLAVDTERLGERLQWEPSRGGAVFPHLYGPLDLDAVVWTEPMPLGRRSPPPALSYSCRECAVRPQAKRCSTRSIPSGRMTSPSRASSLASIRGPRAPDDPRLAQDRLGPALREPGWHGGGLRQGRPRGEGAAWPRGSALSRWAR